MSRLPAISLKVRLAGSIGMLVALMALSGVLTLRLLGQLDDSQNALVQSVQYLNRTSEAATAAKSAANDERGYLLDGDRQFVESFDKSIATATEALTAARGVFPAGSEPAGDVADTLAGVQKWADAVHAEFDLFTSDRQAARTAALGPNRDLRKAYENIVTEAHEEATAKVTAGDKAFADDSGMSRTVVIAVLGVALVVAVFVGFLLLRSIRRPLQLISRAAEQIAQGDVDQRVDGIRTRDELGATATAFGTMVEYLREMAGVAARVSEGDLTVEVQPRSERDALGVAFARLGENLRGIVSDVTDGAGRLAASSEQMAATSDESGRAVGEIASAVTDVAQGAERQVRMVEAARNAAQEASTAATRSAEQARHTASAAEQALELARDGIGAAERATGAIQDVAHSSAEVGSAIEDLSERSQRIGGIVDTITGIAEQTNLLALNAAIEAARAGDQGKGFAVVAEEVRKLAEESQSAAAEISGLIGEIQTETNKVVGVVAESGRRTEEGVSTVEQTRSAFEAIAAAVDDMTSRIGEIAGAAEQISSETQQMELSIGEVASVAEESSASAEQVSASTQQTSASTQEIASSAASLADTALQLREVVGRFKVTA
jgi:methyl-accepting chemotaxis protein